MQKCGVQDKARCSPKMGADIQQIFNFSNCHLLTQVKQKEGGKLEGSCKEKILRVIAEVDIILPSITDMC